LGFDACGNQLELQRGLAMVWGIRNQLDRVTLVKRESEPDDYECYVYDRPGHRLRKVHFSQTSHRTLRAEVRYLPGLEIHHETSGEERHVISVEAGRSNVRALHWPEGGHDGQLRYSLSDHLGSGTLELDDEAGVLTREHYYPFGGTACWAGKSALVAKYKTIRYSGKELDVTGLYYYGYRYYAPWLQRWLSSDPAGDVAGSNRYQMVKNKPVVFYDSEGLINESIVNRWELDYQDFVEKRLEARLNVTGKDGARYEFVSSALKHDLSSIESGRVNSKISNDEFYNLYTKDEWSFIRNKRPSKAKEYYAADVVKYQYSAVSKHNGFFGHLPSVIRRAAVTNENTIKLTENLKNGSKEMMDVFLDKTENGKSTKRIVDVFGMTPWKVERIDQPAIVILGKAYPSQPDFLVHVKPAAGLRRSSVWLELESFRASKSEARSLNSSGVRRRSSL